MESMEERYQRFQRAASQCCGEALIIKRDYCHFEAPDTDDEAAEAAYEFILYLHTRVRCTSAASSAFTTCLFEASPEDLIDTIKQATLTQLLSLPNVMVDGRFYTTFHEAAQAQAALIVSRFNLFDSETLFDPTESSVDWIRVWLEPDCWVPSAVALAEMFNSLEIEPLFGGLEAECQRAISTRTDADGPHADDGLIGKVFHYDGSQIVIHSPPQLALLEALWENPSNKLDFDGVNYVLLGKDFTDYNEVEYRKVKNLAQELSKKMRKAGMPLQVSFHHAGCPWKLFLKKNDKSD
jgi:hypothetical protein